MDKIEFTRDETNRRLTIERLFSATPDRLWAALTKPALLDRWWAPKPWQTKTIRMDFRVGGQWLYAMQGPEGETHHGLMDYLAIEPNRRYEAADVFCDAEGKQTRLVTVVQYTSVEDMQRVLEMGMQEGLTLAYEQLEAMLAG